MLRLVALAALIAQTPAAKPAPATAPATPPAAKPAPTTPAAAAPAPGPAAPAADADGKKKLLDKAKLGEQGPLDFRCDNMQVLTKPNRTTCTGNVIVRRTDILVCCRRFEGIANDKWEWERLICHEDVRAKRGEELMWSDRAEFMPDTADLLLTGRPVLQRGQSLLEGETVVVNIEEDRARVTKPRGTIGPEELSGTKPPVAPPSKSPEGPLPLTCPVGAPPKR